MHGGIFCPLSASYFSIKCINMQKKYLDMQNSYNVYVNMQQNHDDMLENCNQLEKKLKKKIIKKFFKNIKYRTDATYNYFFRNAGYF